MSIQYAFAFSRIFFDDLIIHHNNFFYAAHLKRQFVVRGELFENGAEFRVIISRHGREEVMFKLILHATEEVLSDSIITANSTSASEVVCHVAIRSISGNDVFCLVIASNHDSHQEATNDNSNEGYKWPH